MLYDLRDGGSTKGDKNLRSAAQLLLSTNPHWIDVESDLSSAFQRASTCVKLAGDDRDIDLYHWSSERFSSAWVNTISVLLAKGRARVSVADAATDWPKRIRDMQYLDHESIVAGA